MRLNNCIRVNTKFIYDPSGIYNNSILFLSTTLLLMLLFAACKNSGKQEDPGHQNQSVANNLNDTITNPTDIEMSTEPDVALSAEIVYRDFEKLDSDVLENAASIVQKKGFQQSAKTVDSGMTKIFFQRINPDELLEITSQRIEDGERHYVIDYYTVNEQNYNRFLQSLEQYKFNRKSKSTFVKQGLGTYESIQVSGNGRVYKNSNNYFWIRYYHNEGKEISVSLPFTQGE